MYINRELLDKDRHQQILIQQDLTDLADTLWLGPVGVHSLSCSVKEQRLENQDCLARMPRQSVTLAN